MAQRIVIAAGIEIRDQVDSDLLPLLDAHADRRKGGIWTYPKGAKPKKVKYEIAVVYTMAEFASALDAKDAYVAYEGHSRYGQGPAFGPKGVTRVPDQKNFPVNPWGVHFRMGFDATDTECVSDLLGHSVMPLEFDLPAATAKAFLPAALTRVAARARDVEDEVKAGKRKRARICPVRGAWRSLAVCDAKLAATKTARGEKPLDGRHYYAHLPKQKEYLTAVTVGSADLDRSPLKCKVLLMSSCSSRVHFLEALDRRRKAAKSSCKFYMTSQVCSATLSVPFLKQVFKGQDPTTSAGMKIFLKAMNGEWDSGMVGVY